MGLEPRQSEYQIFYPKFYPISALSSPSLVLRVSGLLTSISSSHNLLIISHQATLRCLMALLLDSPLAELPYMKVPLHTVIKVTMNHGQRQVEFHRLPVIKKLLHLVFTE